MRLPIYQVDAFATEQFGGNPASVVPLDAWLPNKLLQQIAMENNQSETAFLVAVSGLPIINISPDPLVLDNLVSETPAQYEIKWFTPEVEINLCGHATLAAAYVLFNFLGHPTDTIVFHSQSGMLKANNKGDKITLDFPRWMPNKVEEETLFLTEALGGAEVLAVYRHRDWLVELKDEHAVQLCSPDFELIKKHFGNLIITAAGKEVDFVSRFFAPGVGINEDPVTGSAHAQLIPYWHQKTGKAQMTARQLSARGGYLEVEDLADRITMTGKSIPYLSGEIYLAKVQ